MTVDKAQIINILDAERGVFTEETIQGESLNGLQENMIPYPRDARGRMTIDHERLMEAATTAKFPDLLRMGVRFDVFNSYNETPVTYPLFTRDVPSTKQKEEYLKDAALGIAPIVAEGQPYPEVEMELNDGVEVPNHKRGYIIPVTEEMQRFDQLGKVRQLSESIGRSLRLTEELAVMDVLTTTGNYTRNSSTGDNDEGANTQTLAFSATSLITAFNVLSTMKDRKTGVKLGVMPNTLIIAPKLKWAAVQLILSRELQRVGQGADNAQNVYGGGTNNPFFNMVDQIIVSPHLGDSYQWSLMERNRAIYFQRVDPVDVQIADRSMMNESYITRDVIRYRGRTWFGVGMVDDRFAFYSDTTSAPEIS
jgi:hypothetical protein